MNPRVDYEMSAAQLSAILEACKPVPYIIIGGHAPSSQQENANAAWGALGKEMGFDYMTVRPGSSDRNFTAVPSETEEQQKDRTHAAPQPTETAGAIRGIGSSGQAENPAVAAPVSHVAEPALREHADKLEAILKECDPFLKEGETPAECIARNRKDADMVLGELVKDRLASENLQNAVRSELPSGMAEMVFEKAARVVVCKHPSCRNDSGDCEGVCSFADSAKRENQ